MLLELFIARARGNREQLRFVRVLFSHDAVREQRHDAIGRSRSKDDVGRHLEDLIQIESCAQRLTHLVNLAEDVCFSLQRFQDFVAAGHGGYAHA